LKLNQEQGDFLARTHTEKAVRTDFSILQNPTLVSV